MILAINQKGTAVNPELYTQLSRMAEVMKKYFRATLEGADHLPKRGGALLVANHGIFGYDAVLLLKLIYDQSGRILRPLSDHAHFRFPVWRDLLTIIGAVEGTPENAVRTLKNNELVLVFPGGVRDMAKDPHELYRLKWEKAYGFIRVALAAQKPIIPVAGIGPDDAFIIAKTKDEIRDTIFGKWMQFVLGHEKYVMPFPLGIGPMPLPVKFTYYVGRPISLKAYWGQEKDPDAVRQARDMVKARLEKLIDRGLKQRRSLFSG